MGDEYTNESADCTSWDEEESIRRARNYGDLDGIEMHNFRRGCRIEKVLKDLQKRVSKLEGESDDKQAR